MRPTISVIAPVYNVRDYVAMSIKSIVAAGQAFCAKFPGKSFEILAVDDGSTDGSGDILDELKKNNHDPLIEFSVLHPGKLGVSKARQMGLDTAKGEYLGWVDPDDWVEKEYYVRLYETAIASNADLIACDFIRDEKDKSFRLGQAFDDSDFRSYLRANVSGNVMGSLCNKLFRSSFIHDHQITFPSSDCETMEDLYFDCSLIMQGPRLKYLPEAYYHYVYRKGSLITQPYSNRFVRGWEHSVRLLETLLQGIGFEKLFYNKKADVKFGIYSLETISDQDFYRFCPEVRSLVGASWPLHHRVLFWIVVHFHCRRLVLRVLSVIRGLRK